MREGESYPQIFTNFHKSDWWRFVLICGRWGVLPISSVASSQLSIPMWFCRILHSLPFTLYQIHKLATLVMAALSHWQHFRSFRHPYCLKADAKSLRLFLHIGILPKNGGRLPRFCNSSAPRLQLTISR